MSQSESLASDALDRPTKPAMLRGAICRCPACGEGKLYKSYLKVNDHCPACNEALHHQQADDGPAYLTILLVSHLGAPLLLAISHGWSPAALARLIPCRPGRIELLTRLAERFADDASSFLRAT